MESTVSIIGGFATLFGIAYYFFTTRHRERMLLLERGADPSIFKQRSGSKIFLLTLGIISIGLSIGIACGYVLESFMIMQNQQEIAALRQQRPHFTPSYPSAYLISVFFFAGISLIISYFVVRKSNRANTHNQQN